MFSIFTFILSSPPFFVLDPTESLANEGCLRATQKLPIFQVENSLGLTDKWWVERAIPPLQPCNNGIREVIGINAVQELGDFSGSTITAYAFDVGRPDVSHQSFEGRVVARDNSTDDGHATHVIGTILAGGSGSELGMAPKSMVVARSFQPSGASPIFYTNPGNIETAYIDAGSSGIEIFNASLGINASINGYSCDLLGTYGLASYIVDLAALGEFGEPILSVWSAGNERSSPACSDWGSVGPPATCKNGLAVGATYSDLGTVALFSSFGPSDDGRIKPDIVAPGSQLSDDGGITSTEPDDAIGVRSGTSMSAPAVTGAAILVTEAWNRSMWGSDSPGPEVLRAVLCGTATDLLSNGPDFRSGFGEVNVRKSVESVLFGNTLKESFTFGGPPLFREFIPHESSFTCTVAWSDRPYADGSSQLRRDLDIYAVSPSGEIFKPWILDPQSPSASAVQNGTSDKLNTIEQLEVSSPEPGVWQLVVLGNGNEADGVNIPVGICIEGASLNGSRGSIQISEHSYDPGEMVPFQAWITKDGRPNSDPVRVVRTVNGVDSTVELEPVQPGFYSSVIEIGECGSSTSFHIQFEDSLGNTVFVPSDMQPLAIDAMVDLVEVFNSTTLAGNFENWEAFTSLPDLAPWEEQRVFLTPDCRQYGWPRVGPSGAEEDVLVTGYTRWGCGNWVTGGCSEATTPSISSGSHLLTYDLWYSPGYIPTMSSDDDFIVYASWDFGQHWVEIDRAEGDQFYNPGNTQWINREVDLREHPSFKNSSEVQLKFSICDSGEPSRVVVAIDNVKVFTNPCHYEPSPCPSDLDENGEVEFADLLLVLNYWNSSEGGDANGDGIVGFDDVLLVLNDWGTCS